MTDPKQPDGSHLRTGSIQGQLNALRAEVEARDTTIAAQAARIRALTSAIRDLAAPASRAVRVVEEEP